MPVMEGKDQTKEELRAELDAAQAERNRLEEELQECRNKLRTVFENANDEIVYTDMNGTIVDVNNKIEDIYGYKPEEVIGKNYVEIGFLSAEDLQTAGQVITDIMSGKPGRILEFETFRKDGTKVFIEVNSKLITKDGEISGFLNIVRDISERKQAEKALRESEKRFHSLYSSMSEGVCLHEIVHDESGNPVDYRILDVNPAYEFITGITKPKASRRLASELYRMTPPPHLEAYANVASSGEPTSFETYFPSIKTHFSISAFSPKRGKFATIFRDITERKRAEYELKRHQEHLEELVQDRTARLEQEVTERKRIEQEIRTLNEELEQRVNERTVELENALEELKKLDEMKDSFLSSVSHELRTPLTSIRSFSEILMQYDRESLETQQEFLQIINTESERLTRLIDDLLDLARIESKEMVYKDTLLSIQQVVEDVVKAQYPLIEQKSLHLTLDISQDLPFVLVDHDRIQQVVTNLLANAVKFSFEGAEICIRAEAFSGERSGETSEWIKVCVSDQGIGIEEEHQEIIFDKFRQVSEDSSKEKPKGTGLGLPICKEIVSRYGGNIWVVSQKGEGSNFFFTLPATAVSDKRFRHSLHMEKPRAA
jgi:PAS domain S-box-containing protein